MNKIVTYLLEDDPVIPENDDFGDWKEVTNMDIKLTPKHPKWWKEATNWEVEGDWKWTVFTSIQDRETVTVFQFIRSVLENDYDPGVMADILIALAHIFGSDGFRRMVVVLSLGEGYEPMLEAIDDAVEKGVVSFTSRSGMAISLKICDSRSRRFMEPNPILRENEEDLPDEDLEDAALAKDISRSPDVQELSLSEIKSMLPGFFSRKNTKFFGTKKIYKFKGNYVVLKNVNVRKGMFGATSILTSWPIYQFVHDHEHEDGDLVWKAEADDLEDAKHMIKTGDFTPRKRRLRAQLGLGESTDEVQIRDLSPAEAKEKGYDISEIKNFPIRRMSIPGSFLDYEEGERGIWILMVGTKPQFQNQGKAKFLLSKIKEQADRTGKSVFPGTFTEDGERYLKKTVDRLWPTHESADDDDFSVKDISFPDDEPIKGTDNFQIVMSRSSRRLYLMCLTDAHPRRVEISDKDFHYLNDLDPKTFDMAAVFDFGCGVFRGPDPEGEQNER